MSVLEETNAPPSFGGMRVRPTATLLLFVMLAASAGVALVGLRAPGYLPGWLARSAPWLFLAFAMGFAVYRAALVRTRRYRAFKAFFQVALMMLFFLVLLLGQKPRLLEDAPLEQLLSDSSPRVRALAAELSGRDVSLAPLLVVRLSDEQPLVARKAHQALVGLNGGVDLGPWDSEEGRAAWKARFP